MNGLGRLVLIAAVVGGIYLFSNEGSGPEGQLAASDIDLKRVLDVTVDTIVKVEKDIGAMPEAQKSGDAAFLLLADKLAVAYNAEQPPFDTQQIGVVPLKDASLISYADKNKNNKREETEDALFLIEVDGQNSRVIATSRTGAVSEHGFSGSGMLAGFLIGSMLSRQRSAGAAGSVAKKKPVSATQARARARSGSGSHSRGK